MVTTALTGCQISVSSSYNAKWQTISVPIPDQLTAARQLQPTGCWVRLEFFYGNGRARPTPPRGRPASRAVPGAPRGVRRRHR